MRLRGGGGRLRKMGMKMWWKKKKEKKKKKGRRKEREEKGGMMGRCKGGGQVGMGWDGMGLLRGGVNGRDSLTPT